MEKNGGSVSSSDEKKKVKDKFCSRIVRFFIGIALNSY